MIPLSSLKVFFFNLMGIKSRGVYALAGWRHPLPWCPPPMWLILTNSTFTSKYYDNVNGATDIRIMSAFWSTELCTQAPWVFLVTWSLRSTVWHPPFWLSVYWFRMAQIPNFLCYKHFDTQLSCLDKGETFL